MSEPRATTDEPKMRMPNGIRIFLVYALAIMSAIGLSMRYVIDLAISAPVSLTGVVVMILLAYTIFTITLVLQRKQAARGLSLGLASLTLPTILLGLYSFTVIRVDLAVALTALAAALAIILFRGLLRPEVRTYLDRP
jgi:hypothetical protein